NCAIRIPVSSQNLFFFMTNRFSCVFALTGIGREVAPQSRSEAEAGEIQKTFPRKNRVILV
ncbi:MAG: hypothetical protein KBA40_02260, partial [Candidatus Peribacteraceae bacterium]|nr:hypothetical protein [Candidatus Peribacteraceae bacterium]